MRGQRAEQPVISTFNDEQRSGHVTSSLTFSADVSSCSRSCGSVGVVEHVLKSCLSVAEV